MIFYIISSKKVKKTHILTGTGGSSVINNIIISYPIDHMLKRKMDLDKVDDVLNIMFGHYHYKEQETTV